MATSARLASLLEQRRASKGLYSGDKIRVLAPSANSGLNTIARRTATAETDTMVSKYNDGLIGNEEMQAFLSKQASNPVLTSQERSDIQDKVRDFDGLVQKDKLEAVYKAAPDGSLEKIQAAQTIADFYKTRAEGMQSGTPAQSQALQNAGTWNQTVTDLNLQANRVNQTNVQRQLTQYVNTQPTSSSLRSGAEADMYKKLYDLAVQQGDTANADKYAAAYNQAITMQNQYTTNESDQATKQQAAQQKKMVVDQINTWLNDYHDNRMDANTLNQNLAQIAPQVDATGDTALQLSFNRTLDTIQKDIKAGGLQRVQTGQGLWAVIGKGSGAGLTGYDQSAYTYSNQIRVAEAALKAGVGPDGQPYTPQQYAEDMNFIVNTRATNIDQQINDLEQIASQNPNERVVYNGSKVKASDALDSLYKEQASLQEQVGALQAGTAVLVEVPPNKGSALGKGKAQAVFKFVDSKTLDPNTYAKDEQGVYHAISAEEALLTPEMLSKGSIYNGYYTSNDGKMNVPVSQDSAGNWNYKTGKQVVDIYEPGTSNKATVPYTLGQSVPSWTGKSKLDAEAKASQEQTAKVNAEKEIQQKQQADVMAITSQKPSLTETPLQRQQAVQKSQQEAVQNSQQLEQQATAGTLPVAPVKVEPIARPANQPIIQSQPQPITATATQPINQPAPKPVSQIQSIPQQIQQTQIKPVVPNAIINSSGNLQVGSQPVQSGSGDWASQQVKIGTPQINPIQQAADWAKNQVGNLATKIKSLKFW